MKLTDTISTDRRKLIKSLSLLTVFSVSGLRLVTCPAFAGGLPASADFHEFSTFVIGRPVDPVLSGRYFAALQAADGHFIQQLNQAMVASVPFRSQGIDTMLASLPHDSDIFNTLKKITSAWYLGIVGEGAGATLIAFHDALMFQPTREYVFVPGYGGGPDSWVSLKHPDLLSEDTEQEQKNG
ncbi:sugar dehydrogenase complex small subunit [Tatumella citrea]|uniref:Sorbitol dehydrogenase n=1 Tax=Tatumella citrea TaxID=53336 RepID=A0A1Y0L6E5_TATCI|nr:sugar dehydrogenase complex small subunit [Tatumella citrea]ARU93583.1 hypothetical protein A7K98_07210 [Tatumella citrea]ARU97621.1 hypothetical protein A7K99_07210 [Tatumella citrea]